MRSDVLFSCTGDVRCRPVTADELTRFVGRAVADRARVRMRVTRRAADGTEDPGTVPFVVVVARRAIMDGFSVRTPSGSHLDPTEFGLLSALRASLNAKVHRPGLGLVQERGGREGIHVS